MVYWETMDKGSLLLINESVPFKTGEGLMRGGGDANLDFVIFRTSKVRGVNRKAALLMQGIITSHPFVDGNKRTAFIAAKVFLERNGKRFDAIHDLTKVEFTMGVAQDELDLSKMANWFANHTRGGKE
jgi:prophage maintenance system killer protein